jgi:hypothetical protein
MYTFEIEYTKYHFSEFLWSHFWRRQSFILGLGLIAVLIIMSVMAEDPESLLFMMIFGTVLYSILISISFYVITNKQITKNYNNRSTEIKIHFDEHSFSQNSLYKEQPVQQTAPYTVFNKIIVTRNLILLYLNFNIAVILPKACITEGKLDDCIVFLKESIQK